VLEWYRSVHASKQPAKLRWSSMVPRLLMDVAFVAGIFVLGRLSDLGWFEWACYGAAVGSMLRDIAFLRGAARMWPVLDQLLDWQQTESLLADRRAG
jgi:hypothetical protein